MGLDRPPGMDPQAQRFPPSPRTAAIAIGLVAAVILYAGGSALLSSYAASFFAIPFFVGIIVGVLSPRRPYRNALVTVVSALVISIVTLREGVVCVIYSL